MIKYVAIIFSVLFCLTACSKTSSYEDHWMDAPAVLDQTIINPNLILSNQDVATLDLSYPVVITVHGFTASTYEWQEFYDYVSNEPIYVSPILLGAHGRSLDDFRQSSWEDWGKPILDEYNALVDMGFTTISIAASSTGGTLVLDHLANQRFNSHLTSLFFIDSLVVNQNKQIHLVPYIQGLLSDQVRDEITPAEQENWYNIRPVEALAELHEATKHIQTVLAEDIVLPENTRAYIFQSTGDKTVNPISAYMIYKSLNDANSGNVFFQVIDSDLHVFTRLSGRYPQPTQHDIDNQTLVFDTIIDSL